MAAGFESVHILNEPTAAAIAYRKGDHKKEKICMLFFCTESQRVELISQRRHAHICSLFALLCWSGVFDLGGGTFDVSFVSITKNGVGAPIFTVKACEGDPRLGGSDLDVMSVCRRCKFCAWETGEVIALLTCCVFNRVDVPSFVIRLFNHLLASFNKKHPGVTLSASALVALRSAAEQAKCRMGSSDETTVKVALDDVSFEQVVVRDEMEAMFFPKLDPTLQAIKRAFERCKMKPTDVDRVALAGGSTRLPQVREIVKKFFSKLELDTSLDPDLCVALGAGMLAAKKDKFIDMVMQDIASLTISIGIDGGISQVILHTADVRLTQRRTFRALFSKHRFCLAV